jgi:hypothetical protein
MSLLAKQEIVDIWGAIRVTAMVVTQVAFLGGVSGFLLGYAWLGQFSVVAVIASTLSALLLSVAFIHRVWRVHSSGIVIDKKEGTLTFPAADVENTVVDILTFRSFFNLARTETLKLSAVRDISNDTKRTSAAAKRPHQDRYGVNIMGIFGSRQIPFNSKQKRDEFRSAIVHITKRNDHFLGQDNNIDFPSN